MSAVSRRAPSLPARRRTQASRQRGSGRWGQARQLARRILCDQFEDREPDDPAWLDVVLAVHPQLDPIGLTDVASVGHEFVLQEAVYSVTPAEARRIRRAFGDAPLNADLGDGPDTPEEQRRAIIRSLATAAAALADTYAAALDNP